jgi:hypothetical protein
MRTYWIVLVASALGACADNVTPGPTDAADASSMLDATTLDVAPDRAAMDAMPSTVCCTP